MRASVIDKLLYTFMGLCFGIALGLIIAFYLVHRANQELLRELLPIANQVIA